MPASASREILRIRGRASGLRGALWAFGLLSGWLVWPALAQPVGPGANPPPAGEVAVPADGTISERLNAARQAFDTGRFAEAAAGFAGVERDYAQNPQAAKAIAAHRALHAMATARAGQYAEALPLIEAAAIPETTPAGREILAYLRAICLFQLEKWKEARDALMGYFENTSHPRQRRLEALLMAGSCYQKEGDHAGAAKFYSGAAERLRKAEPVIAARADLVSLQSLLLAGDLNAALEAVRAGYREMKAQPQVITFQMLTLDLGNRFLGEKRWLEAIVCFQRVWARERLLRHQRDRIEAWQRERAVAARQPDAPEALPRLDALIAGAENEIKSLEANPGFDAATRFRLAHAFLQLRRHAEAATILEAMLENLPPDPVVEQSAVALLQCWLQARRWEKAVAAAGLYEKRFAAGDINKHHPEILLLKATALESDARYSDASEACADLVARFPKTPQAETAAFKQGWLLLMADRFEEGLRVLKAYPGKFPKAQLREDAAYWEGEALAMLGRHDEAREKLADYLDGVKKKTWRGDYTDGAVFRRAYCLFATARYDDAIKEFRAFAKAHPNSDYLNEANLLLGDALCGVGEIKQGIAAYDRIRPASGRFYEEGVFKKAKALRLSEEITAMRDHLVAFLDANPKSSRAAEAVHWIGWTWQQSGDEAKAREIGWETVAKLGQDPEQTGVDDILEALAKMHRRDPALREDFPRQLQRLIDQSTKEQKEDAPKLLACRAHWARARFVKESDPNLYRADVLSAAGLVDPRDFPSRLSVDVALALEGMGQAPRAGEILGEVRRWHPRTLEKARIFAGLGRIAEKQGDSKAALAAYERFEKEAIAPPAALRGEVLLARARLEMAAGRSASALARWKDLQADRALPARLRAEAFMATGRALAETSPAEASAYFERVYVAYGGFHDLAADAYVARAACLEKLGETEKAREVYLELLAREDLAGQTEAIQRAREKTGGGK